MLESSLSYIIVRSFPECILLIIASYIFLDINIKRKDIAKESILYVVILTLIRKLPISFGIHTVLSMFTLGIILYKIKKQQIIQTILTIAKIFICLAISEGIYLIIINNILGIPTEMITNNTSVESALLTMPSLIVFIILVIILKFVEKKIQINKK